MSEDYTRAMCVYVEMYIEQRTGRRIKIIFNDAARLRTHLVMLREAYNHAQQQLKK
jgi:hypothetical protein